MLSKLDDLHIVPRTEPQSWRLSYFNTEDSQMEDAFIRLQGILCSKMLPPVSKTMYVFLYFSMYTIPLIYAHTATQPQQSGVAPI